MHSPEQYTTGQQPGTGPSGRGTALVVGVLAFAIVFLLIVGVTVGYLVLRPSGDGGASAEQGAESSQEAEPEPAEDPSQEGGSTESDEATPTDVEEVRCWKPESNERSANNPSGKLRGGGLQFIPPAAYDQRATPIGISYANDLQGAQAQVEDSWYSTMFVGEVQWQPGVEYPGAEVASQKIVNCLYSANIWGETKGRSLDDEVTEPVTIAGLPGYRTTATINFAYSPLEKTSATQLVVVVLETEQGPSVFGTETAVGVEEHEQAAEQAYDSLTGVA